MNVYKPFIVLLVSLGIFLTSSCKNDVDTASVSDKESIFFEDYESPAQKWGFLDKSGAMAIDNIYDDVRDFSNGIAQANLKGKWGFIDKKGKEVIPFRYKEANNFVGEYCLVTAFNDQNLIIDRVGTTLLQADSTEQYLKLKNDHIIFKDTDGIGLQDLNGNSIIPSTYEDLAFVSDHLLAAKIAGKYQLINLNNQLVSKDYYDKIYPSSDELIKIRKDKKLGFLDAQGKVVIAAKYDFASPFYNDRAAVCLDGSCMLIDKKENIRSEKYSFLDYGGEGLWMYAEQSQFGFIDEKGSVVVRAQYDIVGRYKEGFASFSEADQWGYLDKTGKEALPASFPIIWDFSEGLARYIAKNGVGFIDTNFQVKIAPKFFETRDFHEGLARVQTW